jgi:hypothetical protein
MFPRQTIPLEEMTPQDWQEIEKRTKEMFDLDAILNRMARGIEPLLGDTSGPCTGKLQVDARDLALRIDNLPAYLASGDTRRAALEGIEIGWLSQRIHDRQFEPKVIQVNSTTRKLREGAQEQQHDPAKIDKAIRRYNALCRQRPNAKRSILQEQVRAETGIPPRTLRRYLPKK